VYFTPPAVVDAQVRLVQDILQARLGCPDGFGDPRVAIVDPATGSGAYPLAIRDLAGPQTVQRMSLFEKQPGAAALARVRGLPVREENALTTHLEPDAPVLVCLGNPPYRRRAATPSEGTFLVDLVEEDKGVHRKNLYNEYVYFWQWALRTVCEQRRGPGVVCFVTAASYLRGPAFGGMRRKLRELLDELWLIDLEGERLAPRASENVFPIRTPVAIALGARYGQTTTSAPANVHYARLRGGSAEKLRQLETVGTLSDLPWQPADAGWTDALSGVRRTAYREWPALTELFPLQLSGAQIKRTWPVGITPGVLRARWRHLLALAPEDRQEAFGSTRDRDIRSSPPDLFDAAARLRPLHDLDADAPCPEPVRYAYRAFDRQWVLADARLGDFTRPALWRISGPSQVFVTTMLTNVLGPGPAAVATALVPDLDHFRGSFGARGVIPLWCDSDAMRPNISAGLLACLSERHGSEVTPQTLMAFCYALLNAPSYAQRFEEELRTPGPRIPLTADPDVFARGAAIGEELLAVHTYRDVRVGSAHLTGSTGETFPTSYEYDRQRATLHIGHAELAPVPPEVWAFGVSGYRVLNGWLRRRIETRHKSSLDGIGLTTWPEVLTRELLELAWLLEATLARHQALDALLDEAISGPCVRFPAYSSIR
jgi:predicted helicase